jgi:hypothetical protein
MKWAGHVENMREKRNVYRILAGITEGMYLEDLSIDNIKIDVKETRRNGMDLINVSQDGNSGKLCEHSDKSSGSTKCREFLD